LLQANVSGAIKTIYITRSPLKTRGWTQVLRKYMPH